MPVCSENEALDSLYSEELDSVPYNAKNIPKKPGWLKWTATGILFSSILSFLLEDYIGPKKAQAAEKGYICPSWCPPHEVPQEPYWFRVFAIKQDDGSMRIVDVPGSYLRYNFTGLDEGSVYEVRVQTCIFDQDGNEKCGADSANRPLAVARIYGNPVNNPPSTNVVNAYDSSFCYAVFRGTDKNPDSKQKCDFNGDGKVDNADMQLGFGKPPYGNWGMVQPNPWATFYIYCDPADNCPEQGTCYQPYPE